jgi:benzoyl-CoA reductase/2-hydroxyglutaryl-CoA dehydratase subunit BcrC/BadD/HgdB
LLKWFEILERRFQIPLFYLDFPQPIKGGPDKNSLSYVASQIQRLIRDLSRWSGKTFAKARYEKVMKTSVAVGRLWQEVQQLAAARPSPINGFDLFVYMSALVTQRGKKETLLFLESLVAEMKEKIQRGQSDFPTQEKGRLLYEGLPCWSALYSMQVPFLQEGIALVASPYAASFGLVYSSSEEMLKAYYAIPPALSFEDALALREKAIEESQPDGLAFALLRTCKIYSGFYYEMERRLSEKSGKPCLLFDADQADEKDFSMAQYQTRLQAFSEILKEGK